MKFLDLILRPSESKTEEIIAALWFIAALLARIAGIDWLSTVFFIKAISDTLCALGIALREVIIEYKTRNRERSVTDFESTTRKTPR